MSKLRLTIPKNIVAAVLSGAAAVLFTIFVPPHVLAASSCHGILTDAQRVGFAKMFSPEYSARLIHAGGALTEANMSKPLKKDEIKKLQAQSPQIVASYTLTTERANILKDWLNQDASATVPGWIATTTTITVPEAWVGLSADVFIQLLNGSGDAGRLKVANIAGTVTSGGTIAVVEQVANDSSGSPKFIWSYVYQAKLNGHEVTALLTVCSADLVIQQ